MSKPHPELTRLRLNCTQYRTRCVELEQMFTQYVGGSVKRLLAARSATPEEYKQAEERLKVLKTRGELLETFAKSDADHKNALTFEEFKNAMLIKGYMNDQAVIKKTFRNLDVNSDDMISQSEFLRGVLGRRFPQEYTFKSQIDFLNEEIKKTELKSAEDGDEIEKLLLENETLRAEYEEKQGGAEMEAELERMKQLVNDMTDVHGELQNKLKEDLEREIHRLREFGSAMRNQLNLLQRESVVGARTATRKVLEMSGSTEAELEQWDKETENSQFIAQVRQVFINLDDQHMGDMDIEKFTQAYQWLGLNCSVDQIQKQFNLLDKKKTGLISEEQFLSAVVTDMNVRDYTVKAQSEELMGKLSDFDDHISDLVGGDVSKKLRDRLNAMKADMDSKVGGLFNKMVGITGMNVADLISPEVLAKHLSDAFEKFDNSRDGRLSHKEFCDAWSWLGLKGSSEELREAFDLVDTDKSGLIDKHEFVSAIKDNRLTELNMNVLLDAMGVQLGTVAERYATFQKTQSRRREQRKTMEATLAERLSEVCQVLCDISGKTRDTSKSEAQRQMRDSFEKFDRNKSGELNLEEYKKAWKFLGRPGTDEEITKTFKSVDIDNSGLIEWDEFVFSLQGEEAKKYGLLADIEILLELIGDVTMDLKEIRADRTDAQRGLYSARGRLGALQRLVISKTDALISRLQNASGVTNISDVETELRSTYDKFDSGKTGKLNIWQFTQAWNSLDVGGTEESIKAAFASSERFGGTGMDFRTFVRVVKSERNTELEVRARLSALDGLVARLEGEGEGARRRLAREKANSDMSQFLLKMIDAVLPASDEALSAAYRAKQQRYNDLSNAFLKYDTPRRGLLDLQAFKSAMRFAGGFSGTDSDLETEFRKAAGEGGSGVDFFEFVGSDMGKKANKVGAYGYTKILNKLLSTAVTKYGGSSNLPLVPGSPDNQRNAIRLNARKMVQRMTGFGGVDKKTLDTLGIHDHRAHSITAGMLEHILHD